MTNAIRQAPEQPNRLIRFARRHTLSSYFLLAYMISWLFWLPYGLAQGGSGVLPFDLPAIFIVGGALGPIASAFIMTATVSGRAGVHQLMRRIRLWRVGVQWYVFAVLAFPAFLVVGAVITIPNGLSAVDLNAFPGVLRDYFSLFFVQQLVIVGLAEEPGWRGFALPRLQERYGALKGSLVLGVFWGFWHLPLFLLPSYANSGSSMRDLAVSFLSLLVTSVAASIVFTWVFNHTKGSVLIAMVLHASNNAFPLPDLFPQVDVSDLGRVGAMIAIGAFALGIVALTRGRLGYDHMVNKAVVSDDNTYSRDADLMKPRSRMKVVAAVIVIALISVVAAIYLLSGDIAVKTGSIGDASIAELAPTATSAPHSHRLAGSLSMAQQSTA